MMVYDTKKSGKRIQQLRKTKGYTQEQFADRLGLSVPTIASIETGRKGTSIDTVLMIAELLDCTTDYILIGKESKSDLFDLVEQLPESSKDIVIKMIAGLLEQN